MSAPTNKWIAFYENVIGTDPAALLFQRCQMGRPPNKAKLILHQAQRLVSIADDIPKVRPGREALSLLFLIICAETVAKLADDFDDDSKSKFYVKDFFRRFATDAERDALGRGFTNQSHAPLGWEKTVDALYGVRCDLVHEGRYWGFSFRDGDTPMLNLDPDVIARMSLEDLRNLVVRCAVRAVQQRLDHDAAV